MPFEPVLGWDLGGAHLKAALVDNRGRVRLAAQFPCPLWQGLPEFDRAVQLALARFPPTRWHAVTMTGELADLFRNRAQGVEMLIARFGAHVPPERTVFYASQRGFLSPPRAKKKSASVASANWAASAALIASRVPDAVLMDVGSTTTDIVPIRDSGVRAEGTTDTTRLACEELVYTGVVRTPIMALTDRIPFAGAWIAPMAEHFATTADVYRLTGELPDGADQLPSADNGGKTVRDSARRLARMVGRDLESAPLETWRRCARYLAELQLWRVQQACERVLSRDGIAERAPLVGAGVGKFVVEKLAHRLGRRYRDFGGLVACTGQAREWAASCAPAVAVAVLAQEALREAPRGIARQAPDELRRAGR
jgi:probable H4MPT-linked C1 transfer pathway protein